ncbi:MAG: DUF167 domain-containing protein [Chloroflexi bacterium]|nr:DUF167 domain-containing protein [Chloroflexota bacterium]MBI4506526.1 DUF167 domain-containing protein [Chloroflexota bacterium]
MPRAPRPPRDAPLATLTVRVAPGARQERLALDADGTLRIAVRARAVEGQANRAVCAALAGWLGVPPSAVALVRGAASRLKVVQIVGISADELAARLRELAISQRGASDE